MRISARFLWLTLHIDTTRREDTIDVEHIATVTAYNTAHQVVGEALHDMYCDNCEDE